MEMGIPRARGRPNSAFRHPESAVRRVLGGGPREGAGGAGRAKMGMMHPKHNSFTLLKPFYYSNSHLAVNSSSSLSGAGDPPHKVRAH